MTAPIRTAWADDLPPTCESPRARAGAPGVFYTQVIDTATDKIKARKAMRAEYAQLQLQLGKNRRIIYLGSCLVCLFIGFIVGMLMFYPRDSIVVAVEVPLEPEAQTTSL